MTKNSSYYETLRHLNMKEEYYRKLREEYGCISVTFESRQIVNRNWYYADVYGVNLTERYWVEVGDIGNPEKIRDLYKKESEDSHFHFIHIQYPERLFEDLAYSPSSSLPHVFPIEDQEKECLRNQTLRMVKTRLSKLGLALRDNNV